MHIHTYTRHTHTHEEYACTRQEAELESWIKKWDMNDVHDESARHYRECVVAGMAKVMFCAQATPRIVDVFNFFEFVKIGLLFGLSLLTVSVNLWLALVRLCDCWNGKGCVLCAHWALIAYTCICLLKEIFAHPSYRRLFVSFAWIRMRIYMHA